MTGIRRRAPGKCLASRQSKIIMAWGLAAPGPGFCYSSKSTETAADVKGMPGGSEEKGGTPSITSWALPTSRTSGA